LPYPGQVTRREVPGEVLSEVLGNDEKLVAAAGAGHNILIAGHVSWFKYDTPRKHIAAIISPNGNDAADLP